MSRCEGSPGVEELVDQLGGAGAVVGDLAPQRPHGLDVRVAAIGAGEPLVERQPRAARHEPAEATEHQREQHQHGQQQPVGGDHGDVAPHHRRELLAQPLPRRRGHRGRDRRHRLGVERRLRGRDPVPQVGLVQQVEHLRVVLHAEVVEDAGRRAEVGDPPARRQHHHVVAHVEGQHRVRDHHDHAAVVGEPAQLAHHLEVEAGVEPRGRLVEEEQRRRGEQLGGDRDPLLLAAAELGADPVLQALGELELVGDGAHPGVTLRRRGVGRQPQLGGVPERLLHLELRVLDVLLRHQPDLEAQLVVVLVQVVALPDDTAVAGGPQPRERAQQRRLAGAGGADHRGEARRVELERDVLQQQAAVLHHHREPVGVERELVGGGRRHQLVAVPAEGLVADDHLAAGRERRRAHQPLAVEEGAVEAAEVVQHRLRAEVEAAVEAGDQRVGEHDVVGEVTADRERASRRDLGREHRLPVRELTRGQHVLGRRGRRRHRPALPRQRGPLRGPRGELLRGRRLLRCGGGWGELLRGRRLLVLRRRGGNCCGACCGACCGICGGSPAAAGAAARPPSRAPRRRSARRRGHRAAATAGCRPREAGRSGCPGRRCRHCWCRPPSTCRRAARRSGGGGRHGGRRRRRRSRGRGR